MPALVAGAETIPPEERARQIYLEWHAKYTHDPRNLETTWQFARACFDAGEFATNSTERAEFAEQGIAASHQALLVSSNSAPAHYYLGMNLGQLARTRGLSALKLVGQMEHEFTIATQLDEHFDYAGPDRNLGLLYRDAPSFGSIGNKGKARQHLIHAGELAPDYPENKLNLIETFLKWNDHNAARRELIALEQSWPKARTNLAATEWSANWADWEPRFDAVKKKIEGPSKALESPRGKE